MARQVNTKFVLTLATVLTALIALLFGVYLLNYVRRQNPHVLMQQAADAEKAGDINAAIGYITKALPGARKAHWPDCEKLELKRGDLYYQTSTDGNRYARALDAWQNALVINPKYKDAIDRLLRENYALALRHFTTHSTPDYWPVVENYANQLIALDPSNQVAYLDRAEAILNQVAQDQSNADPRLLAVEKDLQQASKLMPKDSRACSLTMQLALFRAELADRRGKKADHDYAKQQRDNARKLVADFCNANPADPAGYLVAADMHRALKEYDQAEQALDTARHINPDLPKIYEISEQLHAVQRDASKIAGDLKKLVELSPDDLELYVRQAKNYQDNLGDMTDALVAYNQVYSRKTKVTGVTMVCNDRAQGYALFLLPWCYLDAAEQEGAATPKGKADLANASTATGPLRERMGPNTPLVDLLEGRNSYLQNDLQQAIPSLRRADEGLTGSNVAVYAVRCKLLLADAYTKMTETGLAMKYVDEVLLVSPHWIMAREKKVNLLLREARYDEAYKTVMDLLHDDPKNVQAQQLEAAALAGLGRYADAQAVLVALKESSDDPQVAMQEAQMLLFSNEPDEVVSTLMPVLQKTPDNDKAILLISMALIKLDRKDEAKSYLEKGLVKFPDNVQMKMLSKTIDEPNTPIDEIQKAIINGIKDPYERNWALAQFYAGRNDYKGELAALQECEKVKHDSDVVIDRIFSLALRAKDWDLAQQYAQRAGALNLDLVQGKLFEGRYEYAKGDKDRGIETLRAAVAQRDDYSMGWTILGQAYADMQNTTEAIKALEQAVSEKPDNVYALKGLILLYINQHDDNSIRMAENYLKSALQFAPRDPQLRDFDDIVGQPKEAIEKREALRKIDPKNMDNLRRLAVLYTKDNQVDKAIDTLKDLVQQKPDDLNVADALARLYRDRGMVNEAINMYEPFLTSKDPDTQVQAHLLLGDMYRTMSQVPEAVALYEEVASKDTSSKMEAQRRLADLYFELDDMPHAETMYKKIYDTESPKDVRVLRRYIETLIRQDKFALATDLLNSEVLKDKPDDAEGLVLQGYAYLRQHKAKEALDSFQKVLDNNPDNVDALHYRAFTNFTLMNNHAAAINDLLHIRGIAPNAINSRLLLARVYYADKQFPEAAHEYQEVLSLRPDMTAARLEYADMLLNITQIYMHMSDEVRQSEDPLALRVRAVKPVETLTDLLVDSQHRFPKQSTWPIMLGNLYGLTGEGDRAAEIHKAAFIDSGKNLTIGLTYVNTLMNLHRYEEAMGVINDLLDVNTSLELYARRGAVNAALGHLPEARSDFTRAFDMLKDVDGMVQLAKQCYLAIGPAGTTALFADRLKQNPKDYLSRVGLALVYSTDGNNQGAIDTLTPLLANAQAAPAKLVTLRMLAMSEYQLKAFDKSLTYYQQLLDMTPDDLEALNNIAYLLANDLKRPEDGMKYAQRARQAIENRPIEASLASYSNVMDTVGWVKFLADDVEGASDDLQRSLQMNPLPICYYHLAMLYQKQHRMMDAKNAAEQCIKLGSPAKDPVVVSAQALLEQLKKAPPA